MSPTIEATAPHSLPMSDLLDNGDVDPAACVAAGLRALAPHLSPGMAVSSLTLDLAPLQASPEERLRLTVRVEKSTRSVAFTSVEARTGAGSTIFGLRALCARPGTSAAEAVG